MILKAPDNRKSVRIAGTVFRCTRDGYFEVPNQACFVEPLKLEGFYEYSVPFVEKQTISKFKKPKSIEYSMVIIRCGCGEPESHAGNICPKGIDKNLGVVDAYYRNPFKQFSFIIKKFFGRLTWRQS